MTRTLPEKEYRRYLRSPEWRARRLEAIKRAGWRCQGCGVRMFDEKKFQVHHKPEGYERLGCERPEDIEALCRRCHRRISTW